MIAEWLRVLAFVTGVLDLGWIAGMMVTYRRLNAESDEATWVPRAMQWVSGGVLLLVCGLIWRSVQFFHSPFTVAQVISDGGLVVLALGLRRMVGGLREREERRQAERGT